MEVRGRRLGRRQDSKESRDSSVSSTTREVRCGCQYFQSDSLLPERHNPVGTRPSSRNMGDHEYEPINPPANQTTSPPLLKVTDQEGQEKISEPERIDFTPIINSSKHQYLRIPLDKDMVIPLDKAEVESIRYDDEEEVEIKFDHHREVPEVQKVEKGNIEVHDHVEVPEDIEVPEDREAHQMTAQEIQDQIEERFFAATPSTTVSRTDGEFNTSQMDSSGLDELPLKKDARRGFNAKGFQQRVQSQAGRLRSRIRNMSRPKFNFPERPKLHLPEKPKFNLPERPKFNFKRPDLKMPNINFGKAKTSSIRRPLRDRAQIPSNQSTVGSKKNIFDSINFRTYPRIFSKKKKAAQGRRALTPPPRMETESTPPSSPASRTGPFNQRWSHRFKDIQFADDDNQSDIKKPSFDDEVEDESAAFHEPDLRAVVTLTDNKQMKALSSSSIPGSDREQQSSGSSSERHRAGVIEEIDSDEFFLREKGLSRDDVDVSRYLSHEIRDAFRSPKNALASLDNDMYDDDNERYELKPPQRPSLEPIRLSMEAIRNQSLEQIRMTPERDTADNLREDEMEPVRPERTRSLKKRSTRSRSEEPKPDQETQFNTFPPNRPTRARKERSQSKHSIPPEDYNDYDKENEHENIEHETDRRPPSVPSLAITDTTKELSPTRYIDESSEALNEPWVDERQPPLPPKRRKSMRESSQDNESLSAHQYKEQWIDDVHHEDNVLDQDIALQRGQDHRLIQNGYYDRPPSLPMRKSRSRGTSLADEDRTSRGADSLVSETRTHLTEDFPADTRQEIKASYQDCDYAAVEKTIIEGQPKFSTVGKPKPVRPPPPSRKKKTVAQLTALKNQGIHFFYTYPRRAIKKSLHKQPQAPIRPVRNYSSIGPARPPRRNRVFREPFYEGEFIPLRDENEIILEKNQNLEMFDSDKIDSMLLEAEIEDKIEKEYEEDEIQDIRDLQSGDVIEKMKGRPLPPPPRPPRKSKDDTANLEDDERDIDLDAEVTDLDAEDEVVVERIDIFVSQSRSDEVKREKSASIAREDYPQEDVCDWHHESDLKSSFQVEESKISTEKEEHSSEPPVKTERRKKSLSVAKRAATPVSLIEATVSTQTDTLPDGYYVEEEQKTIDNLSKSEETLIKTSHSQSEKKVETERKIETIVEHKVVVIPTPETEILKAKKIQVAELDVEKLNVAELQAKKITVSDIDGVSMQITELTSKSGHLVVSGFDLPSSFLEAITPPAPPAPIIQIQSSTQTPPETTDSQTNTTPQEEPPVRQFVVEVVSPQTKEHSTSKPSKAEETTEFKQEDESSKPTNEQEVISKTHSVTESTIQPPPSPISTPPPSQKRPSPPPPAIVIQTPHGQSSPAYVPGYIPSSPPPRSPPRTRALGHDSEDELRMLPRRRRHHSHKHSPQYSSDEEDEEYPSFPVTRRTHQRELTSNELIRQLLNIWQTSLMRSVNHVVDGLNSAFPDGEKRKDAQTAACIVLVLLAGLIMLGFGSERTVHHHHWDFLPPHP